MRRCTEVSEGDAVFVQLLSFPTSCAGLAFLDLKVTIKRLDHDEVRLATDFKQLSHRIHDRSERYAILAMVSVPLTALRYVRFIVQVCDERRPTTA